MAEVKRTHREVKEPQISGRYLADYMAASDVKRRSILQGCKYPPIARVVQHNEAKLQIGKFLRAQNVDPSILTSAAKKLRTRLTDSDFDKDVLDHNADYLDRFAKVSQILDLPEAERLAPGKLHPLLLEGVKVTADVLMRLRRTTRTNKLQIGLVSIRYSKNRPLKADVAEWQSAFLFGYVGFLDEEEGADPEKKLCITIDGHSGTCTHAPSNTITRIRNMEAACAGIYERWDKIPPPSKAVF